MEKKREKRYQDKENKVLRGERSRERVSPIAFVRTSLGVSILIRYFSVMQGEFSA